MFSLEPTFFLVKLGHEGDCFAVLHVFVVDAGFHGFYADFHLVDFVGGFFEINVVLRGLV